MDSTYDWYPNDISKEYTEAEKAAAIALVDAIKTTGTTTDKDGITHYTSADGTYVDVPEYWLNYQPQFSKLLRDDTMYDINYFGYVCQSNTTMCEGVADPWDFNFDDLDGALAAAAGIGMALVAFLVIFPIIVVVCICVCCCYCNKCMCFKPKEYAPPMAQLPQKQ